MASNTRRYGNYCHFPRETPRAEVPGCSCESVAVRHPDPRPVTPVRRGAFQNRRLLGRR